MISPIGREDYEADIYSIEAGDEIYNLIAKVIKISEIGSDNRKIIAWNMYLAIAKQHYQFDRRDFLAKSGYIVVDAKNNEIWNGEEWKRLKTEEEIKIEEKKMRRGLLRRMCVEGAEPPINRKNTYPLQRKSDESE